MKSLPLATVLAVAAALLAVPPARALTIATIGQNFTGSDRSSANGFIPPDTMGAVGPAHIVELLNGAYSVYDKNGTLQSRQSLTVFWNNAGVSVTNFAFDPRVVYDPFSGRWFAASVDNVRAPNNILLAVSNSSNPLDGWRGFTFDSDPDNNRWADFPTLGFNGNSVTVAANLFPLPSGSPVVGLVTLVTVDKASLIAGAPAATPFLNIDPNTNNTGFTLQPTVDADNRTGSQPLLSDFVSHLGFFKRSDLVGSPASATLDTNGGLISVGAAAGPPLARQPGGPDDVNTADRRLSSNVLYRLDAFGNNSFWGVQSIDLAGRAALRWFEIDADTDTLRQEGTIANPDEDYYFGSIAVNDRRQVVIGFSCSSATLFISSCAVTSQNPGGATTTFGERVVLKQGSSSYQVLDGSGRNRWGDYSATVLDPADPTGATFWTFQEFASGSAQWSVQITQIFLSAPSTGVPEPGSVAGLLTVGTLGAAFRRRRRGVGNAREDGGGADRPDLCNNGYRFPVFTRVRRWLFPISISISLDTSIIPSWCRPRPRNR